MFLSRIMTILSLVMLAFSCSANPSGKVASLPADWPEPSLALPSGSTEALLPLNMRHPESNNHHMIKGPSSSGRVWMIAFKCDLSFDELVCNVESSLTLHNYVSKEKGTDDGDRYTVYETSDGLKRVKVGYSSNSTDDAGRSSDCFYYSVIINRQL